ncbi:RHS repeat-associated core domain-containing protein [Neotamlana laminarinivorans]|uniref:BACON domain-containing protein n=1 Tax=Neotamlana laminarinivorans TaxID=2883124 RepID=A0A9X1HZI3_9FLAO|nr:RHS repeat-associated core domain-containing protein [Tamlana laminarinivorans]MCB4797229.1 hypothetical protein [Tamlana laminarinivorans]
MKKSILTLLVVAFTGISYAGFAQNEGEIIEDPKDPAISIIVEPIETPVDPVDPEDPGNSDEIIEDGNVFCPLYIYQDAQKVLSINVYNGSSVLNLVAELEGSGCKILSQVQNNATWLSLSQFIFSANTNFTVTIAANNTPNTRSESIVFYQQYNDETYLSGSLTIVQEGNPNYKAYYVDSDGDGYGDYNSSPKYGINPPTVGNFVENNLDYCPNEYSVINNGCIDLYTDNSNYNWIKSYSYNINNDLTGASKAYFDELGKAIQTQTLDVKKGRTWATQILYDSQGRPAINTLSAPVRDESAFGYSDTFMQNKNGNTYSVTDFETDPNTPEPVGKTANTLGFYYSEDNETVTTDPDPVRPKGDSYQDITEYPFSRTVYSQLNPGTVLKTIGGNKINGEWKQGYTFSMPAGDELTQSVAFGDASYKVSNTNTRKIIKTVSRDVHNREAVIFTDTDGKTLAAARVGGTVVRDTDITISQQGFVDVHVPAGTVGFNISGVAGITTEVYNLITEVKETGATTSLNPGFYRVSITNLENYNPTNSSNTVTVICKENYYDYSLNEYDEKGRLIASYQPVGTTKADKPVSTFQYNALGQLTHTSSPDEGDAWFLYRKDGQIRFSINSKQWENLEFSYTNYDNLGRPIESGVYSDTSSFLNSYVLPENVTSTTNPFKTALLNIVDDVDGLNDANCSEVQNTAYDYINDSDWDFLNDLWHDSNNQAIYGSPTFLAGNVAKTHNDNTTTYYSYDIYGRVKWIVQNIAGLGTTWLGSVKTIDYEYDPITSQVTKVIYQKNEANERFIHRYTYDAIDNSLITVETSTDDVNYTTQAEYKYYETGALKRVELAPQSGIPLQAIDYVYNLNGQLKAINPTGAKQSSDLNDLFSMQIDYHSTDYNRTENPDIITATYGEDQFNGNIKGVRWTNTELANNEETYSYYYNKNNWLTDAIYGTYANSGDTTSKVSIVDSETYIGVTKNLTATSSITLLPGFHAQPNEGTTVTATISGTASAFQSGEYNVSDVTYDANGNIRTLNRNKNGDATSNAMDQLTYAYNPQKPNQLLRVDDAVGQVLANTDINDQDGENYEYNQIGQLIKNNEENITYIYNASGLVTEVKQSDYTRVKFFYNDKGYRVKKEAYVANSTTLDYTEHYIRDAAGTALAIYRNGVAKEHTIYGASRLGVFNRNTTGTSGSSVYQLTDHLGNVRAVVQWSGTNAAALVATDYYPFGMPMPNRNLEGNYRYKYQGQEKDPETGKEAFELRLWDSRIGRWLTTDPAGQYASPYLGMGNNPINGVDPDGAFWKPILNDDGTTTYVAEKGDTVGTFAKQYGVSRSEARELIGSEAVTAGVTKVSGQDVFNMFGSEKLKLDLNGGQATDQRILDQFIYAMQHSSTQDGKTHFVGSEYFSNILKSQVQIPVDYNGTFSTIDGDIPISMNIQWYTSQGSFFKSKSKYYYAIFSNSNMNQPINANGSMLGGSREIVHQKVHYYYNIPGGAGKKGKFNFTFTSHKTTSKNFVKQLFTPRPKYNYINTNVLNRFQN